jgi:hypothetical protein
MIVVLIGRVGWMLLTQLFRKWPDTGLKTIGTNPSVESFARSRSWF